MNKTKNRLEFLPLYRLAGKVQYIGILRGPVKDGIVSSGCNAITEDRVNGRPTQTLPLK